MKKEYEYISCCGRYYCLLCDYFRGGKVQMARNLLYYVERSGSLRLIAESQNVCDYDEFVKGLKWLASQDEPCRGCRFGGGWSWWPDCPVRDCVIQKGLDFCYQCSDFPCEKLKQEPLLANKKAIVEANNQLKSVGVERYAKQLIERFRQAVASQPSEQKAET
jgi:hypothetical protein